MKRLIIAIDGPSGSGKSSTAKAVAKALGYTYIDSGAMYRATTLYLHQQGIDPAHTHAVVAALPHIQLHFGKDPQGQQVIYLNEKPVETEIRQMAISQRVSAVAAVPQVRYAMVDRQRALGANKGVVMDGRDIGTNVFPEADLKIYMVASDEVRAQRRLAELQAKGQEASYDEVLQNLRDRDLKDSSRATNPLHQAADAVLLDTSDKSFENQVQFIVAKAQALLTNS